MIKIDLVTGFLGAGKTTFILKYIRYLISRGERVAVLENDYGAVNVDALLLGELEEKGCGIETVAGGCDHDCHVRRFKTKLISLGMQGFDRVIVEPSGIFDVDEFFDVLHEEPLDRWYETGNVIAVMDIHTEIAGMSREAKYFILSETAGAGILLLSHLEENADAAAGSLLSDLNGLMEEFGCDRRYTMQEVLAKEWDQFTAEDFEQISSCGYRLSDHIKLPLVDHNSFSTLYYMNLQLPLAVLRKKAEELFKAGDAGNIIRIKGFHRENEQWYELNAVSTGVQIKPCSAGQEVLIVIGENLKQEEINRQIKQ